MSNPSKAKGSRAEVMVVDYLKRNGFPYAERRALAGSRDRGDIAGVIGAVIEIKNHSRLDLGGWIGELEDEMDNDGARVGAVIHKRRGTQDVGEWYATLPVSVLVELLREWAA